ncbi:hypothetical protein O6P43_027830 [Quillaja saponaria]|uniref:Uncharacterized protein n=1 Tax=Quillaja saponaria TaxID=32244 RepID=A0AAD7L5B2_QUISA|nr:hypothetical protein O6P43_027830 [Quillaja saponaria]
MAGSNREPPNWWTSLPFSHGTSLWCWLLFEIRQQGCKSLAKQLAVTCGLKIPSLKVATTLVGGSKV